MAEPDLLAVALTAFLAVFALLGALAGLMRALVRLFPPSHRADVTAEAAAISAVVALTLPGARVTHIEEVR